MDYRDKIRQEAQRRGISHVLHFTQIRNLPTIVEFGLLSRTDLMARDDVMAAASAAHRIDERDGAVSVSISAVNLDMFGAKSHQSPSSWLVLFLDAQILWTHSCRFNWRNAARKEMLGKRGHLGGPWAFSMMFDDADHPMSINGGSYRALTGIPDLLPTYPDAEVQVFDAIAPDLIAGAWVSRDDQVVTVSQQLSQLQGPEREVASWPFNARFSNGHALWG